MALAPLDSTLRDLVDSHSQSLVVDTAYPHVTLTYAQSLDAKIAAAPGKRTLISGPTTKTMTHYIRFKHDAILIGINTVLIDNPSLSCKFSNNVSHFITPIIIDPNFKFSQCKHSKQFISNYKNKINSKPIFIVSDETKIDSTDEFIIFKLPTVNVNDHKQFNWNLLLKSLKSKFEISSIMIEGGATIINELLTTENSSTKNPIVDTLIVTIGPVFLGEHGVGVNPNNQLSIPNTTVWTDNKDIVLFSRFGK
ncbi:2,5-diamino-6-(ribosylamino)-4(3H)-pyrimidinone 5'-phosphate reductase [Pichia californica]|uniref:2,5-diamino-6-ribosylamino-4(3H)-pyrimidinone 5'-phosphate reductase n=1 Tax=Pichia californica TaxID=460514 RepID=A0A9P7BI16_9ASCO|nr:2,5-diamino-6-(ribosylamino)-4(3H)-pyrimidinone 5'-phosphate reductase [[Candida] californica]KAG0691340.1 2,5-diamino-6-(ribosylamino)-4(3H)-pyrimidinone 5'-phosphate reductase [[Candida] californica]